MNIATLLIISFLCTTAAGSYGENRSSRLSYGRQHQPRGRQPYSPLSSRPRTNQMRRRPYQDAITFDPLTQEAWKTARRVARRKKWMDKYCSNKPLLAISGIASCPAISAVTKAFNNCTYVFAKDLVFEICIKDNLRQRTTYNITELFPRGPKRVTAALTNAKTGVTILLNDRLVYRYKWIGKRKRFCETKRQVRNLPREVGFMPTAGFQNVNGDLILMNTNTTHFVVYNDRHNEVVRRYGTYSNFPQLRTPFFGVVDQMDSSLAFFTRNNAIQIFDMEKRQLTHEYPLNVADYMGCRRTRC